MASGSLFKDFDQLKKKDLEMECAQRGIQPIGLGKKEMIRRLKAYERKMEKRSDYAAEEEEEMGDIREKAEGRISDSPLRFELIGEE